MAPGDRRSTVTKADTVPEWAMVPRMCECRGVVLELWPGGEALRRRFDVVKPQLGPVAFGLRPGHRSELWRRATVISPSLSCMRSMASGMTC